VLQFSVDKFLIITLVLIAGGFLVRIFIILQLALPFFAFAADPQEVALCTQFLIKVRVSHVAGSGCFPDGYKIIFKEYWIPIHTNTTFANISAYFKWLTKTQHVRLEYNGNDVTRYMSAIPNQLKKLEIEITHEGNEPVARNRNDADPLPNFYSPFNKTKNHVSSLVVTCQHNGPINFFQNVMQRQIDPKHTRRFERW
jgi:hypothetical protein